jgi:hypothetical protein
MARHETDGTLTLVATWAAAGEHPEVGTRWPLVEGDLAATGGGRADPPGGIAMTLFPLALPSFARNSPLIRIFDAILWFSHRAASVTGAKRSIAVRLRA